MFTSFTRLSGCRPGLAEISVPPIFGKMQVFYVSFYHFNKKTKEEEGKEEEQEDEEEEEEEGILFYCILITYMISTNKMMCPMAD